MTTGGTAADTHNTEGVDATPNAQETTITHTSNGDDGNQGDNTNENVLPSGGDGNMAVSTPLVSTPVDQRNKEGVHGIRKCLHTDHRAEQWEKNQNSLSLMFT